MRATLHEKRRANRGSIAFSIAAHVVAIALIASITFRYPLSAFFAKDKIVAEKIQYVDVRPRPVQSIGNGAEEKVKPKKALKPAPLIAPTSTPTELPPVAPPSVSAGAISGTGTGSGGAPVGIATGVEPAMPDSRIELKPNTLRLPLSTAQKNDSAVKAIYMAWREAEIAAEDSRPRSPKDWTVERNGQKFGLDSQYIYLGKFKVPSAILAALPFNTGGVDGSRIIAGRNADWIRNDIYSHSQGLSEDDFRAAVKRIRERKDRERKEAEDEKKASQKATPVVP
ncbi:MAG: hypothetical protein JWM41_2154 [Gemmatimonadetes bacterium]|nr:hypothetical protein [Gemmatimonadota bacterium]